MSASVIHRDEIIRRRIAGEWPADIARALGVTRNIVIGVCYRAGLSDWEAGKAMTRPLRGEACFLAKLTEAQVREIRAAYQPGVNRYVRGNCKELAAKYGIHPRHLWTVATKNGWAHVTDEAA